MSEQTVFKGKITWIGDITRGTSNSGKEWSKREFTIQFGNEKFPESVTVSAFPADKADQLVEGCTANVAVNFSSYEHNGRRFNSIMAWKCDVTEKPEALPAPTYVATSTDSNEDLPF